MALSDVGTAYVIIKANTEQLAGDIGKGFKKGVADADEDISKAGSDSGKSYKKGFLGEIGDGEMGDGVNESLNTPEMNKNSEDAGRKVSRHVKKGHDDENKKHNPFSSLKDSLGQAFKGMAKLKWPSIILSAPEALGGAANLITAALAGVTEALGFIVQAAAGAGVALAGVALTALPAFGLLFAAFKVQTDEMDAFKETAKPLVGQWKNVAAAVQHNMLPAVTGFLEVTGVLVPMWTTFGDHVGTIAGNFVTLAGKVLTSNSGLKVMGGLLKDSEEFFRLITDAAGIAFEALWPLVSVITPIGVQLAGAIHTAAENLATFLSQPGKIDELGAKFQDWYDKLATVGHILADLFVALWNVLGVAGEFGTTMFDSLEKVAGKWRDWTGSVEGQNQLKKWFEDSQPLMHEMWLLLTDISKIVFKPFVDVSNQQGTVDFVHMLRTDWLPVFERLGDTLGKSGFGDALLGLANALIDLLDSFQGSSTIVKTIESFTKAVQIFADVLASPAVAAVAPTLATFYGALKVFEFLKLDKLALDLFNFGRAMMGMSEAGSVSGMLGMIAIPLLEIAAAVAAIWAVWHYWDQIIAGLQSAWEWFTKLAVPLQILIGIFAVFTAVVLGPLVLFAAAVFGVIAAIKNWDKIGPILDAAWDAIFKFFTRIPKIISGIPEMLGGVFDSLLETITGFVTGLPSQLAGMGSAIKDALLGGIRDLPSLMLDALGGLGNLGLNLIGLIADGLAKALPALASFFVSLPFKIIGWIVGAASDMLSIGFKLLAFIIEGLVQAVPKIMAFFLKLPFEIGTIIRKGLTELVKFGIEMIQQLIIGLIEAWPRIKDWFADLPGNILRGLGTAALWLLRVGRSIIDGMWQGLQTGWDVISSFFSNLPGRLLEILSGAGGWLVDIGAQLLNGLWSGIQEVWASVNEFFVGMPSAVLTALGDFFGFIWTGISAGTEAFLGNIGGWITTIVTTIAGLPMQILTAIGDIGMTIWNAVSGGFTTALTNIGGWVTDTWGKFTEWAADIPGKVAGLVTSLPAKIGEALGAALTQIGTWVTDGLAKFAGFVTDVPGKLGGLVSAIGDKIGEALDGALTKIGTWVTDALGKVGEFVTGIPGKIAGAAGALTSGVFSALKTAWNAAVDLIPSFTFDPPGPGSISISADFLKFGMGGIIPGSALGMPIIVGEQYRSEAVVPMQRPGRALAVMQQAGLDKLVLNSYLGASTTAPVGPAGDVTMLHIERAVISAPVDADMIVQKISTAYRRMAS